MTLTVGIVHGLELPKCSTLWVAIQSRLWLNYQVSFKRRHGWNWEHILWTSHWMSEPIQTSLLARPYLGYLFTDSSVRIALTIITTRPDVYVHHVADVFLFQNATILFCRALSIYLIQSKIQNSSEHRRIDLDCFREIFFWSGTQKRESRKIFYLHPVEWLHLTTLNTCSSPPGYTSIDTTFITITRHETSRGHSNPITRVSG